MRYIWKLVVCKNGLRSKFKMFYVACKYLQIMKFYLSLTHSHTHTYAEVAVRQKASSF